MNLVKYILVCITIFELGLAKLKSCLVEKNQPEICFNAKEGEEGYVNPFPVAVKTELNLKEIVSIDEDENSITMQIILMSSWKDPRIAVSNKTIK